MKQTSAIHILPISQEVKVIKDNKAYNEKYFSWKIYTIYGGETSPRLSCEKPKLSISLDQSVSIV